MSAPWFPTESVRWAWVAFDVVPGVSLYRLSSQWHPRLAEALATVVTLAAALTLLQAITYDLPRCMRRSSRRRTRCGPGGCDRGNSPLERPRPSP